jgi:hypothetical protein
MRSITYPLSIENGTLKFSEGSRVGIEQIRSVLETRPTERIERPAYGTPSFVFTSLRDSYIVGARIEAALVEQTNLPDINVEAEYVDAAIELKISFNNGSGIDSVRLTLI